MVKRGGFTLVELIVVVAIIGILISMAILGVVRYQQDSRDTRRSANVATIAEALEKYFDEKGEYPSCAAITASADTVAANTLKGIKKSALVAVGADEGTTNSIRCGQTLTMDGDDFFEYSGSGGAGCIGAVSCTDFTIKYRSESENAIKSVSGRRVTF